MLGDDVAQGAVDVFGHARGVAADVEVGAVLEPGPQLGAVITHPVLDVDLGALVAGEGQVEVGEDAVVAQAGEFVAVVEVGRFVLFAEEQPVGGAVAAGTPFVEEADEGGDAGTGTDHDHRGGRIGGWPEMG